MPRKPKPPAKQTLPVNLNGTVVTVVLHPPQGARTCWYAYWSGAGHSRSSGCTQLAEAMQAAEQMLRRWQAGTGDGKRAQPCDTVLSDDEFREIQRVHFGRQHDQLKKRAAAKSLEATLEAIDAFRAIVDMAALAFGRPIVTATADVCSAFQREAVKLPVNWRKRYPKSRPPEEVGSVTPNTVRK